MAIGTANTNTKLSIAGLFAEGDDLTAIASWTNVGEITDLGEFGEEAQLIEKEVYGDGYTRKAKGVRNAGSFDLTVLHKANDAGQQAMRAANATNKEFAMKIELETGEKYLFAGLVMSDKRTFGAANEMVGTIYKIEVPTPATIVPAA